MIKIISILALVTVVSPMTFSVADTGTFQVAGLTVDTPIVGTQKDAEVSRKIRDQLINNDSLSPAGKNVKIVTRRSSVTLKGTVDKQEEINIITETAQQMSGARKIKSELKVKQ